MTQRRIVVGVVGPSGSREEPVYALEKNWGMAVELGKRLAKINAVVLSGGDGTPTSHTVKDGVLQNTARKVSILPGNRWQSSLGVGATHLTLQTALTNHQRNILTGQIPDVVIAILGGSGTCAEVACALQVSRPVVLLGNNWPAAYAHESELEQIWQGIVANEQNPINQTWASLTAPLSLDLPELLKQGLSKCRRAVDEAEAIQHIFALRPGGVTSDPSWAFGDLKLQKPLTIHPDPLAAFERDLKSIC